MGHYTTSGQKEGAQPKAERYELAKVTKSKGDYWLFQAGIHYGNHNVTLPLPLRVVWAGDTPVITVDNVGVPGSGTYSARVLIYKDTYAGSWTGGDHGGLMNGVITRAKE